MELLKIMVERKTITTCLKLRSSATVCRLIASGSIKKGRKQGWAYPNRLSNGEILPFWYILFSKKGRIYN
jgi:hypothetical protein